MKKHSEEVDDRINDVVDATFKVERIEEKTYLVLCGLLKEIAEMHKTIENNANWIHEQLESMERV